MGLLLDTQNCACARNVSPFFPPSRISDPDMHHGTCVTHVPWYMPELLTSGFLWNWWRGKLSRHSQRMHNPQFCVSAKRPMALNTNNGYTPKTIHTVTCHTYLYSKRILNYTIENVALSDIITTTPFCGMYMSLRAYYCCFFSGLDIQNDIIRQGSIKPNKYLFSWLHH